MNRMRAVLIVAALAAVPFARSLAAHPRPARADTACADVWLDKKDGTLQYVAGPDNCVETGESRWMNWGTDPTDTGLPGPYIGAGVNIWITFPL